MALAYSGYKLTPMAEEVTSAGTAGVGTCTPLLFMSIPSRGPTSDACDTHRCERTANNGLSSGDEAELAWSPEASVNFEAKNPEHCH